MKLATVRTSLCGVFAEEVAEDLLVPQLWSPKFLMSSRWVRSDLVLGGTPALPGIQFRTQNQRDAPAAHVEGRNWSGELADPVVRPRFFRVDAESTKECPVMSFSAGRETTPWWSPSVRRSHVVTIRLYGEATERA